MKHGVNCDKGCHKNCKDGKRTVLKSLHLKHPDARMPSVAELEHYDEAPAQAKVIIDEDMVVQISGHLSGGASLGSTDSLALQQLLLALVTKS